MLSIITSLAIAVLQLRLSTVSAAETADPASSQYVYKIEYCLVKDKCPQAGKGQMGTFLHAGKGFISGDAQKAWATEFLLSNKFAQGLDQFKMYSLSAKPHWLEVGTSEGQPSRLIYASKLVTNYLTWTMSTDTDQNTILEPTYGIRGETLQVYKCDGHFQIHDTNEDVGKCEQVILFSRSST